MDVQRLVKMANDIGSFFESDGNAERGAKGVADHIRMFWDPRMRRQILEHLDEGGAGLKPLVFTALKTHSHELDPVS
jgi:formate dehydrogenase subunit delta